MRAAAGRDPLRLELLEPALPMVAAIWRELEPQAAPSYFLSWGWLECWLASLPPAQRPQLAVVRRGERAVAAFFIGRAQLWRHHVLPSRARFLNTTGSERYDSLCIEHNELMRAPGTQLSLATLAELLPADWDELFLPAVDAADFADADAGVLAGAAGVRVRVDEEAAAPWVDLRRVRAAGGDYLSLLSANSRAQIRRAQRRYGRLAVDVAATLDEARAIYAELVRLHQARWQRAGRPGAFADPWFDAFHRRLIERRLPHGEIQLVRVRAGGATIGCLYNLVLRGRVLFYQSGLAPGDTPQLKPGYVCHAEAVRLNAAAGHAVYDLLGGDSRYKQSLATDAGRLTWLRLQQPRRRFRLEDRLRQAKHAARRWLRARRA